MRFALGVDDDLGEFYRRFRRDPLLGPLIRRRPQLRPQRRPWPWEALAWAVVKQLIESDRAARIQRRIVGRWGPRLERGRERRCATSRSAELIAGRAPAELERAGPLAGALGRARGASPARSPPAAVAPGRAGDRPPPAGDPGDRPLDRAVPRPLRPRRTGLAAGRRPDVPEAGRPPGAPRPPRHGRGGRGVLRALSRRSAAGGSDVAGCRGAGSASPG